MKLLAIILVTLFIACDHAPQNIRVNVTEQVISANYMGNGVQWDGYPEAEMWGASVSDQDWEKLYKRLDFMKPNYIRCLINSPFHYYNPETGQYDKTRNIETIARVLQYCQDNGITVLFGEYNPPTWDMKDDPQWIAMAADYLNYLVTDLGFTCIKYYNLFNEPDGSWASTNGDFYLWKRMLEMFYQQMQTYPGLTDKVQLAAPDIVVGYTNPASPYKSYEWVDQTVIQLDNIVGLYDIHAYPGQHQVRSGQFAEIIERYRQNVPEGKQIILGEAGYKYWRSEDSLLMAEYNRRALANPFTLGTDCNMFVYDFFYGLDMPLLAMDIMNAGFSALAAWMLDDAMHSTNDAGNKYDIKLWGMWNILGEEVFGLPEEEEIRPWFHSWSLMCRYFPAGTNILRIESEPAQGVRMVAGTSNGALTVAMVNFGDSDYTVSLSLPTPISNAKLYEYKEIGMKTDANGFIAPVSTSIEANPSVELKLNRQTMILLTDITY